MIEQTMQFSYLGRPIISSKTLTDEVQTKTERRRIAGSVREIVHTYYTYVNSTVGVVNPV